jgi:hypothetical protein
MTTTLKAKPILKDKFWIVEQDGQQVATIQAVPNGVVLVNGSTRTRYPNIRVLSRSCGVKLDRAVKAAPPSPVGTVYGFPVDVEIPYNTLYNVARRVPVYTKTAKSKSMFCAGYYLIQHEHRWVETFCPKLITINRYPYLGPYYSEDDMLAALEHCAHD